MQVVSSIKIEIIEQKWVRALRKRKEYVLSYTRKEGLDMGWVKEPEWKYHKKVIKETKSL